MLTEKVHLFLKPNAVPYRVSAARQIPLRFREPAEACIKELLAKNVITLCHTPTEWCSPAFFVIKPDRKNVRMVTDFTRLNSFVKRPVHPFACVSEILQNRPSLRQILRQDGCSERLFPNSPGRGILHEDNIPAPKRKIQIPPHTPRPQCLFRRMVSKVRHGYRWSPMGQENRG